MPTELSRALETCNLSTCLLDRTTSRASMRADLTSLRLASCLSSARVFCWAAEIYLERLVRGSRSGRGASRAEGV